MTHWEQGTALSRNRKSRRQATLRRMAQMRAAKAAKRMASPPAEPSPKRSPYFPLELGVRDTRTGEVAWVPLRSVRDAGRRLRLVLKFYR
jgi:hypothetical protein